MALSESCTHVIQDHLSRANGANGVKAYVIAGRHSARVCQAQVANKTLKDDKDVMRFAKVFLLSSIGDEGAQLLGAQDNKLATDATRFAMTFLEKVIYLLK